MRVIGFRESLPASDPNALVEAEWPDPEPGGHDLVVEVRAVSVNPIDTKVRRGATPLKPDGDPCVLGWDAAGVVKEVGPEVKRFQPGDAVWYAGALTRPGTNAELHVVDERIVGAKPQSLDYAEAAALPLTTLTAWELLFERLEIPTGKRASGDALLVVGAGGGVGSILVQLAARLTSLEVIGTASRLETQAWVRELGVHHVLDHANPLSEELRAAGVEPVRYAVSLTRTDLHFDEIVACLAPQGRFGLIDDPGPINVGALKPKSASLHWELMFTRSLFGTADIAEQGRILDETAFLIDRGVLRTTMGEHYGPMNAANLRRAHETLESGTAKGKIVLEGFGG